MPSTQDLSTQDLLRRRFTEACTARDAIAAAAAAAAAAAPLRKQRDDILAKAQAQAAKAEPLMRRIREIEAPLYDLHNEIATIARALSGQTAAE